jgi:hypothetical protein
MLRTLNDLNRNRGDDEPDNRTVQRDLKMLAWTCLEETFRPSVISREAALKVLAAAKASEDAEKRLNYYEERLQLIETAGVDENRVRIVLDPLAEYLAGLHLVERNGAAGNTWQPFLKKAQAKVVRGERGNHRVEASHQGFLRAVLDCCESSETKVPDAVTEQLRALLGEGVQVAA